jgi:hypothetical protein
MCFSALGSKKFFLCLFQRRKVCAHDDIREGGLSGAGCASAMNGEQSSNRTDGSSTRKVCSYLLEF